MTLWCVFTEVLSEKFELSRCFCAHMGRFPLFGFFLFKQCQTHFIQLHIYLDPDEQEIWNFVVQFDHCNARVCSMGCDYWKFSKINFKHLCSLRKFVKSLYIMDKCLRSLLGHLQISQFLHVSFANHCIALHSSLEYQDSNMFEIDCSGFEPV